MEKAVAAGKFDEVGMEAKGPLGRPTGPRDPKGPSAFYRSRKEGSCRPPKASHNRKAWGILLTLVRNLTVLRIISNF